MSDNNFLNKYSSKIKALSPNDSTAAADWLILESKLNGQDVRNKKRYLFYLIFVLLLIIIFGRYFYVQDNKQITTVNDNIIGSKNIVNNIELQHIKKFRLVIDSQKSVPFTANAQKDKSSKNITVVDNEAKLDVNNFFESRVNTKGNKTNLNNKFVHTQTQTKTVEKSRSSISSDEIKEYVQPLSENLNFNGIIKDIGFDQNVSKFPVLNRDVSLLKGILLKEITLDNRARLNHITFTEINPKSIRKMKYFIKLDGGTIFTNRNVPSEMMQSVLSFSAHSVSKEVGIQTGLNIQAAFNERWKIGAGIIRGQLMHHASHTATLRLMDGVCLNPNSIETKEYAFTYNVEDGHSSSIVNLKLSEENVGTSIDSTTYFTIDMGMHRKTVAWAIPITVERKIYSKRDWSIHAKGGVSFGFASNINENITHFTETCAELCFNHGFSPSIIYQHSNKITTGIILGTSIEWRLSPKIVMVVNPEIINIINMYQGVENNNIKWGINIGTSYQIR